jgi:hypothetical protein
MRRIFLLLVSLGALTACDTFYGPVLVNKTVQPVTVIATFSGSVVESQLQPNQAFWQGRPGRKLEALTIIESGTKTEVSRAQIEAALAQVPADQSAVIQLLPGGQIGGTTIGNLRK